MRRQSVTFALVRFLENTLGKNPGKQAESDPKRTQLLQR